MKFSNYIEQELDKYVSSVKVYGISESWQQENAAAFKCDEDGEDGEDVIAKCSIRACIPFYRVDARIVQYMCEDENEGEENVPSVPFSSVTRMPSAKMDELWDSLKFGGNPVKERLLSYLRSGNLFRKHQVRSSVVNWHG